MADVDDRNPALVAQPLDIGQDLRLARLVERGQRLVHQQQPRTGRAGPGRWRRAASRRPKAVPAGGRAGADAEQVDDPRRGRRGAPTRARTSAVEQVLAHGEVREQPAVLEHVAEAPPVRGHEDAARGVDQNLCRRPRPDPGRVGSGRR